jgi:hypothetical protein
LTLAWPATPQSICAYPTLVHPPAPGEGFHSNRTEWTQGIRGGWNTGPGQARLSAWRRRKGAPMVRDAVSTAVRNLPTTAPSPPDSVLAQRIPPRSKPPLCTPRPGCTVSPEQGRTDTGDQGRMEHRTLSSKAQRMAPLQGRAEDGACRLLNAGTRTPSSLTRPSDRALTPFFPSPSECRDPNHFSPHTSSGSGSEPILAC